uniref:Uncharacterized protein n=1 Tax=Romanomermis culicivorax TaxID=13658 RepID=A0A915IX47_ROMCU
GNIELFEVHSNSHRTHRKEKYTNDDTHIADKMIESILDNSTYHRANIVGDDLKVCPTRVTPCQIGCDLADSTTPAVLPVTTSRKTATPKVVARDKTKWRFSQDNNNPGKQRVTPFPVPKPNTTKKMCKKGPFYNRSTIYGVIAIIVVWIFNVYVYCRFVRRPASAMDNVHQVPAPFQVPARSRRKQKRAGHEATDVEKVGRKKKCHA